FAPDSALRLVSDTRNLVVVRTYSKIWSMAAFRLGFCVGPSWLAADLAKVVLPYHLSVPTQVAGTVALRFADEMRARVAAIVAERERLSGALSQLDVDVWPSGANFILFRPRRVRGVWDGLLERDVLVRDFSHLRGLEGCLRVTVGTAAENDVFLTALKEVLA
ncbi:MAG: aminotransferase class I/II-fold pyridoxal phosphate-dependent enzyme, partial [Acidimicrobiia bacterium]